MESFRRAFSAYGTVVDLDWRPGEKVLCKHPADCAVSDILILQEGTSRYSIIHATKTFGTRVEEGSPECWEYEKNALAMTFEEAITYFKSAPLKRFYFSAYLKKIKINPKQLLDAGIKNSPGLLHPLFLPAPRRALDLIAKSPFKETKDGLSHDAFEDVPRLLHPPMIVTLVKGKLFLGKEYYEAAVKRLLKGYLKDLCEAVHNNLITRTEYPSRALRNLVSAKLKRERKGDQAIREMPPCVRMALQQKTPLNYQLRFQLAEVFSYASISLLERSLLPRRDIDGAARQKNVIACYHAAKKKRADARPCVTRTHATGLFCPYGGRKEGVTLCAEKLHYKGDLETVSISKMWGIQKGARTCNPY